MSCPPGTVLNPRTFRCVKASGKTAQHLIQYGNISAVEAQLAQLQIRDPPRPQQARVPKLVMAPPPCPPGKERNPATGKCITIGGRTYQQLYPPPPAPVAVAVAAPVPVGKPVVIQQAQKEAVQRRESTEPNTHLPVGSATVAPLASKDTILTWASRHCNNTTDPITQTMFVHEDTATLQELIRLHNRTCVLASGLHERVASQHQRNKVATIPDATKTHMTLDDFKALREAKRRTQPGYKIPPRSHRPPPSAWQLYVAPDNRSGPDFASVLYVDITKARATPTGYEYPAESVMIDLGFIPLDVKGARCSPAMLVEIIQRCAQTNRLLTPVAGGWKPVGGFPFTKKYWETEKVDRFSRLCSELTKALTTPF